MKTLSASMEAALASRALDVAWLVRLEWQSETQYLATRELRVGAAAYAPGLLQVRELALGSEGAPGQPALGTEKAVVEVTWGNAQGAAGSAAADGIGVLLAIEPPEGRPIEIGFAPIPKGNAGILADEDPVWIFRGDVTRVEMGAFAARIEAQGGAELEGRVAPLPFAPDTLRSAGIDPAVRLVPPLIFGRVAACNLTPWNLHTNARLAQPLEREDGVAVLESLDGWPASGAAQVGDEVFTYEAVDSAARTLGNSSRPLKRPEACSHNTGSVVWKVPPNGALWLVAGHRCRALEEIRAEGQTVDSAAWEHVVQASEEGIEGEKRGRTLALARMGRIPALVNLSSDSSEKRLNSLESGLDILAGTTAQSPELAIDGENATCACLTYEKGALRLGVGLNLATAAGPGKRLGDRKYGRFAAAAVDVRIGANAPWRATSTLRVAIRRGEHEMFWIIPRPRDEQHLTRVALSSALASPPPLEDSRELFAAPPARVTIPFQRAEVLANESEWTQPEEAIDGSASSKALYIGSAQAPEGQRLRLGTMHLPISGEGIEVLGAWMCVEGRSTTDQPGSLAFVVRPEGGPARAGSIALGTDFGRGEWEIPAAEGRTIEALAGEAARIEAWSAQGGDIELREVWMEVSWRPKLAGLSNALNYAALPKRAALESTASTGVAPALYSFDFGGLARKHGGWGFFEPGAPDAPEIEITFGGTYDPAEVAVYEVSLRLGYNTVTSNRATVDLEATVERRFDAQGQLIENPADVARELLVAPDLGGVAADSLDEDDWAAAHSALDAAGVAMRRRISEPAPVEKLVREMALEAGLFVCREGRRWRVREVPAMLLPDQAQARINEGGILRADGVGRMPLADIGNDIEIIGADWDSPGADGARTRLARDESEESIRKGWGRRRASYRSEWWGRAAEPEVGEKFNGGVIGAERWASLVLARRASGAEFADVQLRPACAAFERGDVIALDGGPLGLAGRLAEIERLALEMEKGKCRLSIAARLRLAPMAQTCWTSPGGEARLDFYGAGASLLWVIGGRARARLTVLGDLRIAGEAREYALTPWEADSPVFWRADTRQLCFAAGTPKELFVAAALDEEGNLSLAGSISENAALEERELASCHELHEEGLDLTTDQRRVHARFDGEAGGLLLRGCLVELSAIA